MPFIAVPPTADEIPIFIALGVVGAGAQWLLTVAFTHAPAAIVAVLNYTSLIWSTLLGWIVFSDWPPLAVFVGSAVIISANVLIIWREHRQALARRSVTPA